MRPILLCVFITLIVGSHGAVYQLGRDPDPDHPGHCNSKESGPMEKGEMKTILGCARAECLSDGSIELASCGISVISTPTGTKRCYPSEHSKKPYPDCCSDCADD